MVGDINTFSAFTKWFYAQIQNPDVITDNTQLYVWELCVQQTTEMRVAI